MGVASGTSPEVYLSTVMRLVQIFPGMAASDGNASDGTRAIPNDCGHLSDADRGANRWIIWNHSCIYTRRLHCF